MNRLTFFILLLMLACSKNNSSNWDIGEGVEIYLTKTPMTNDYSIDYSKLKLDTIALESTPLLRYNDLKSYDKVKHMMTLNTSIEKLNVNVGSVFGRMFIVTIDKKPIYCGFKWPFISSAICSYVFIMDPLLEGDGIDPNQVEILYSNSQFPDPRTDNRLIDRLKKDGKLKE